MNSLMFPALQKFYNALKQLKRFSLENSFFDNIGCIDTFLTEYRSTTFVLQNSLGRKDHPVYTKNLEEILCVDRNVSDWLKNNRNIVDHESPFRLKKILRVTIYDSRKAVEFKKYEQTVENEMPIGDYLQAIRHTFLSIAAPEIYFSAQYVFVAEDGNEELNIFDFIERGVIAMWHFLHAMKSDLKDESEIATKLMGDIDVMIQSMPIRWITDVIDYCYYRRDDSFERGERFNLMMPDVRIPVWLFIQQAQQLSSTVTSFYEAFVYLHAYAYIEQKHHVMNTFFIEYGDGTYQTLVFHASIRTTMYRYINKVANLIKSNDIVNVYLVTEIVSYGGIDVKSMPAFMQLDYKERIAYRTKTSLSFYKITQIGGIEPVVIDADSLVDRLSVSVVMGKMKNSQEYEIHNVALTPIVESFKAKLLGK